MCIVQGQAPEGGRDTNGKEIGTGGTWVWLELNKTTKREQFTRGVSKTEILSLLEGQGEITQFAAKLPLDRVGSKPQESEVPAGFYTQRDSSCTVQ